MCILGHMYSTFFCLEKFLKKLANDQCSSVTKGGIYCINQTFKPNSHQHGSGLTRNLTFNGSNYYVLYLQILRFYFVWLSCINRRNSVISVLKVLIPKSLENEFSLNLQIWSLFKPMYHPRWKNANLYLLW